MAIVKPFVTEAEATRRAKKAFREAMKLWMEFLQDDDESIARSSQYKKYIKSNMITWKKFGFNYAGRSILDRRTCTMQIEMNINYLYSPDADTFIENTLRHELAHCLAYLYATSWGHDRNWKRVAHIIGDDGNRCHNYRQPVNKKTRTVARKHFICPRCAANVYWSAAQERKYMTNAYACKCGCNTKHFVEVPF